MKRGNKVSFSEKDSLYCSFFQKTGACMHGETCSRMHIRPSFSRTLLLNNFYQNPLRFVDLLPPDTLSFTHEEIQAYFDEFYIDIYDELRTYGPIEDIVVSSNLCDHLAGNVLVTYESLDDAINAFTNLRGRYYAGRPIDAQFSPVASLDTAVCRQFKEGNCPHDTRCNFIHPIYPSQMVAEECPLTKYVKRERPQYNREESYDHDGQRNDRSFPDYTHWRAQDSNRESYERERNSRIDDERYSRNREHRRDYGNERDYRDNRNRDYYEPNSQRQYGNRRPDYHDDRHDQHRTYRGRQ